MNTTVSGPIYKMNVQVYTGGIFFSTISIYIYDVKLTKIPSLSRVYLIDYILELWPRIKIYNLELRCVFSYEQNINRDGELRWEGSSFIIHTESWIDDKPFNQEFK